MVDHGWSWCYRPKGSSQAASDLPFPLPLHLWLLPVVFSCSNQGNFSHTITTRSRTSINLEVIFHVGLQSTLLEAHARFLGLLKMRVTIIRKQKCNSMEITNKRPGYGLDVEVVMIQIYLEDLMSKMRCTDHVRDYNITIAFLFKCELRWVYSYQCLNQSI